MRQSVRRVMWAAGAAIVLAALVQGVSAQKKFEPRSGQSGKDVVWVPTPQETVELMLNMAKLTPEDYLMDLGSGDGRTVITAAKRGARARGIEYNPDMVQLSIENAKTAGVSERAVFVQADLFKTDFSSANVLTLFLLPDINMKLRPQILDMKPGTRVVSNTFMMGSGEDEWVPDQTQRVSDDCMSWCTAHLWIVPARVNGKWTMNGQALVVNQKFQHVTGTLNGTPITEGKIKGTSISFSAGGTTYNGTVEADGRTITGTNWKASR